jgi:nucleoid DNA-binding protein
MLASLSFELFPYRYPPFDEVGASLYMGSFALLVCEEFGFTESQINDSGSHPTRPPAEIVAQVVRFILVSKFVDEQFQHVFGYHVDLTGDQFGGEKVTLVGFGTFDVRRKRARNSVNPRTGEKIRISEKPVVKCVPGKAFRERVRELDGKDRTP